MTRGPRSSGTCLRCCRLSTGDSTTLSNLHAQLVTVTALLLNIAPGLANLSVSDCGSNDPDVKQEMEKQLVDLLTEELKLQEAVAAEHTRHLNITSGEAKRVAIQYQTTNKKQKSAMLEQKHARRQESVPRHCLSRRER